MIRFFFAHRIIASEVPVKANRGEGRGEVSERPGCGRCGLDCDVGKLRLSLYSRSTDFKFD
jgi:hypothetical protein